ncbi:hypothetical protein WJX79_003594 [Trebouxia sp. C0005]
MAGFLRQSWRSFASVADNSSWLGGGLKFKCTQCGKCCTGGRERVVWVSEQEAGAIAGSLGLEGDEFADRYLQPGSVTSAGSRLSLRKNSTDTACIFLQHGKCAVYQSRPTQCRTYPFWPEPLTSRHDWESEALRCEGIQIKNSPPHQQHRQHHNAALEQSERDPLGNQETSLAVPAGSAETEVSDAAVPVESVKRQLVLEEISRSGEMGGTTYSDMDELLTSISPELVDEFADEFFAKRGRRILHDSRRWRVLDTWIGDPAEHFRSLVLKACPGYAQTEAMSQKHMHSAAASSLHKPVSVHDAQAVQPSTNLAVAIVGAGACALPMAIRHHFPKAAIDAVDIDAEALDLAQCFFEAQEDAHLMLHNEDGVKFLTKHGVTSQFDVIMLDVAAPDPAGDPGTLNSIPAQFLSPVFIQEGLRRRLRPGALKPLHSLCDELLSEQFEQWAVNDELHDVLRSEYGYGWFSAQDLMEK